MKPYPPVPVLIFLLTCLLAAGCAKAPTALVLTDPKAKVQITLDSTWKHSTTLHPDANIQAGNTRDEKYLLIFNEERTDFDQLMPLEEYGKQVQSFMEQNLEGAAAGEFTPQTINGYQALSFEIAGTVNKVRLRYLVTVLASETSLHQVIFWTLAERYTEHMEEFQKDLKTFRASP